MPDSIRKRWWKIQYHAVIRLLPSLIGTRYRPIGYSLPCQIGAYLPTGILQARVSDDYQPGNYQWKIGVTSMFAHALNIAPFKDTFWTTSHQPGNPYGLKYEPYPNLQAAIATLSTGPVGPSDAVGESDSSE